MSSDSKDIEEFYHTNPMYYVGKTHKWVRCALCGELIKKGDYCVKLDVGFPEQKEYHLDCYMAIKGEYNEDIFYAM